MKKPRYRLKLVTLYIFGFLASIAPLAVIIGLNFKHYTSTPSATLSLSIGGIMAAIICIMKMFDIMPKKVKRVVKYAVAFIIVKMLEPIILDLSLLLLMALVGEVAYMAIFEWQITRIKNNMNIHKQAQATSAMVTEVLKNTGRV